MGKSAIAIAAGLILAGCQSEKIDNSTLVEPGFPVSYSENIQPIFDLNCTGSGCHIAAATSGVRLNSYQSVHASRGT